VFSKPQELVLFIIVIRGPTEKKTKNNCDTNDGTQSTASQKSLLTRTEAKRERVDDKLFNAKDNEYWGGMYKD
jgi:hypothetical protein